MMATEPVVDLVTACKALAARGCDTGIGGHVSLRDPERNEFWINCFDRTLGEMTVSDVVKLDHLGNNVLNDRVVSPGWEFHAGIYAQRPDVNAIVHTHGFWVTALASLNRPLRMRHNLCTLFYEDQVMSPDDSFDSIGAAWEGGRFACDARGYGQARRDPRSERGAGTTRGSTTAAAETYRRGRVLPRTDLDANDPTSRQV